MMPSAGLFGQRCLCVGLAGQLEVVMGLRIDHVAELDELGLDALVERARQREALTPGRAAAPAGLQRSAYIHGECCTGRAPRP